MCKLFLAKFLIKVEICNDIMFIMVPMDEVLIFTPGYLKANCHKYLYLDHWNHYTHDIIAYFHFYMNMLIKGYTFHPELSPPYVFIGMCHPYCTFQSARGKVMTNNVDHAVEMSKQAA